MYKKYHVLPWQQSAAALVPTSGRQAAEADSDGHG